MTGYRNCPVVLEGEQGNLTLVADPNVHNLLEGVYDDEEWDFDGVRGGESAQRASKKRKFLDL